ncbi:molybdopterin-dependent oxidoreductase [Spongisporangium articulatum]|uniref:Molybdopterin-dependent oxidoreductase n=1 Tax=Spongisporangium articulatum TaxID=3362603 RepID=A0ABW8AQ46_9ACTN
MGRDLGSAVNALDGLLDRLRTKIDETGPRTTDFTSRWHDERVAARIGAALGTCFTVCFVTGLLSHFVQHPQPWFVWPAHPASLYRYTQGLHVLTGIAAVPLLLVKLWTVYPRLFGVPRLGGPVRMLERASVAALVASALFQLLTGLQNIAHWYPWGFSFPPVHYALAWVSIGAIAVHVAVQLPAIRLGLSRPLQPLGDHAEGPPPEGPSRRWLLGAALAGAAGAVLATAGQTVSWLRWVSVLAVRTGEGPQGVPVNKTARGAGVLTAATDPGWRLTVTGPGGTRSLSLADLTALPQHDVDLPIACVEGWSAVATWTGVRVRDLADAVGAGPDASLRFTSLQASGGYRVSELPARHVRAAESLVALRVGGEPLALDHGYPARLIAPSRPGVLQTKWLSRIEVI